MGELLSSIRGRAGRAGRAPDQRPSMRLTRASSPGCKVAGRPRRRLRDEGFFPSMWLRLACRRRILPVPVILNLLAAPRWVFILGMGEPLLSGAGPSQSCRALGGVGRCLGQLLRSGGAAALIVWGGEAAPAACPSVLLALPVPLVVGLLLVRFVLLAGDSAASTACRRAPRSRAAWALRSGASTIVMFRPSTLGKISTRARSCTASTTSSRMRLPSSG